MSLYISTGDVMVGNGAIDLYWRTEWKGMVLLIPTGDDDEEDDTVYLYWGRCGRVWRCMSLLETVW